MRRKKKKKQAKQARLHNFCIQEYIRGKVMQPQLHRCKTCVAVIFPCQDYFQHQQVWRDQTPEAGVQQPEWQRQLHVCAFIHMQENSCACKFSSGSGWTFSFSVEQVSAWTLMSYPLRKIISGQKWNVRKKVRQQLYNKQIARYLSISIL